MQHLSKQKSSLEKTMEKSIIVSQASPETDPNFILAGGQPSSVVPRCWCSEGYSVSLRQRLPGRLGPFGRQLTHKAAGCYGFSSPAAMPGGCMGALAASVLSV